VGDRFVVGLVVYGHGFVGIGRTDRQGGLSTKPVRVDQGED
jgi:hypothetical protein